MPDWINSIFRPLFDKVRYDRWEWMLMRIAFGTFVVRKGTNLDLPFHAQPKPQGIAQFVDVTWITSDPHQAIVTVLFYLLLLLYCLNLLPLVTTTGLLIIHTLVGTLSNSQGATHHTSQIVGLVLFGQVVAHVYWRIRLRHPDFRLSHTPDLPSLLVYCSQQLVAAGYVASGISKLLRSEGRWLVDIANFPVQLAKGRDKQYYDTLVEPPAVAMEWLVRLITDYPILSKIFLGAGLFLEVFAFIALMNRPMLALFGIGLVAMHSTISEFMGLGFIFNKAILIIFFVNVPWWIVAAWRRGRASRSGR